VRRGSASSFGIGTGLPTSNNTHEIAQAVAPECRVAYVDNDPLVLARARALLTRCPEGVTHYIDAHLRETGQDPEGCRPGAGLRPAHGPPVGILGHIPDEDEPRSIVNRLVGSLASGSYLALCDGVPLSEEAVEARRRYKEPGAVPCILRSPELRV
jgi:S-adenosyl methyltransferase